MIDQKQKAVVNLINKLSLTGNSGDSSVYQPVTSQKQQNQNDIFNSVSRILTFKTGSDHLLTRFQESPNMHETEKRAFLRYVKESHPEQLVEMLGVLCQKIDRFVFLKKITAFFARFRNNRMGKFLRILFYLVVLALIGGFAFFRTKNPAFFHNNLVRFLFLGFFLVVIAFSLFTGKKSVAEEQWLARPDDEDSMVKTLSDVYCNISETGFRGSHSLLIIIAVVGICLTGLPSFQFSYAGRMQEYMHNSKESNLRFGAEYIVNSGGMQNKYSVMKKSWEKLDTPKKYNLCVMAAMMAEEGNDDGLGMRFLNDVLLDTLSIMNKDEVSPENIRVFPCIVNVSDENWLVDLYDFVVRCQMQESDAISKAFMQRTASFDDEKIGKMILEAEYKLIPAADLVGFCVDLGSTDDLMARIMACDSTKTREVFAELLLLRCTTDEETEAAMAFLNKNGVSFVSAFQSSSFINHLRSLPVQTRMDLFAAIPDNNTRLTFLVRHGKDIQDIDEILSIIHEANERWGYTSGQIFPEGVKVDISTSHYDLSAEAYTCDMEYLNLPYLIIRREEKTPPYEEFPVNFYGEKTKAGIKQLPTPIDENYHGNAALSINRYTVTLDTEMMSGMPMEQIPRSMDECTFVVCMDRIYSLSAYQRITSYYEKESPLGVGSFSTYGMSSSDTYSNIEKVTDVPVYACCSSIVVYDQATGKPIFGLDYTITETESSERTTRYEETVEWFPEADTQWEDNARNKLLKIYGNNKPSMAEVFLSYSADQ